MLFVDGHDSAIIGIVHSYGRRPVLAYNVRIICETLVERDSMGVDEAYEFFEFNIMGSYNGEGMPVFLHEDYEDLV